MDTSGMDIGRRIALQGAAVSLAGLATGASSMALPGQAFADDEIKGRVPQLKFVTLLARKEGVSREQFLKAWLIDHVELSRSCPGINRYVLTVVDSVSKRPGMPAFDIEMDGFAELYFADEAAFQVYNSAPETKTLRAQGETFIGRQLNFVTHEKVAIG